MTFDPTKPVQTRDGRPATILTTTRIGSLSIVALVGPQQSTMCYSPDGRYLERAETVHDLINVPESHYFNIYASHDSQTPAIGCAFSSLGEALRCAGVYSSSPCLGTFKVTVVDGKAKVEEVNNNNN